jgi:hypothetical protein
MQNLKKKKLFRDKYRIIRARFRVSYRRLGCKDIQLTGQNHIGLPCFWGANKYRNLALQVGGLSKIETITYAHESRGT